MAILVEAYTIVLKMETIVDKYPGGWNGYADDANLTLRSDGEIAGVEFMAPDDVDDYLQKLNNYDIVYSNSNAKYTEVALVCQRKGLIAKCEWLRFGTLPYSSTVRVPVCELKDSKSEVLAIYNNWDYERSLVKNGRLFSPDDNTDKMVTFLYHNNGKDVFVDISTNEVIHVRRSADHIKIKKDIH